MELNDEDVESWATDTYTYTHISRSSNTSCNEMDWCQKTNKKILPLYVHADSYSPKCYSRFTQHIFIPLTQSVSLCCSLASPYGHGSPSLAWLWVQRRKHLKHKYAPIHSENRQINMKIISVCYPLNLCRIAWWIYEMFWPEWLYNFKSLIKLKLLMNRKEKQ